MNGAVGVHGLVTFARWIGLGLALLGAGAGCVVHQGAWQGDASSPAPTSATPGGVSLVLVGNAGAPTRWAQTVGDELDAQLLAEHEAGRNPVVLWLGGMALPRHPARRNAACPTDPALASRPGAQATAAAVARHVARGHASFAVPGVAEWACGAADTLRQAAPDAGPNPWTMPAHHYVVRVLADGQARVVSRCQDTPARCTIEPLSPTSTPAALVELVVVDLAPWIVPPCGAADRAAKDAQVVRMRALLAAVRAETSDASPPRILVSSVPVEAAGYAGMGGGGSDAAFHFMPPELQAALTDGVFAGSLAAHDRALYATANIAPGVRRSSRAWVSTPLFQVVAGSASLPDARPGAVGRRVRYFRSNSYVADAYSDRAGFAVVHVTGDEVAAVLHAPGRRGWQTATVKAPLRPRPYPAETPADPLTPCARCPKIPASER